MDEEPRRDFIALLQRLRAGCRESPHARQQQQTHPHVTHQPPAELAGGDRGADEAPRDDDGRLLPGHRDDDEFHDDEVADMLNPEPFGYVDGIILEFILSPPVPGEDDGDGVLEQLYRAATGGGRRLLPADPPPELDQQPYAYGGFGGDRRAGSTTLRRSVPACAEVIAGLEKRKYNGGSAGEEDEDKECSICMMDYDVDDDQSVMPCKHRFHQKCLAGWLALSHLCPLCRHVLPPAEEQEVP